MPVPQTHIDDYVKGRMEGADKAAFEAQMAANAVLAKSVQEQGEILGALEAAGNQEVRSAIKSIHQEAQSKPAKAANQPEPPKAKKKTTTTKQATGQAAVIRITFIVDGQEAEVRNMSYTFTQEVDNIGQPAGEVKGGIIKVSLGSLGSADRFGWAVASDMRKNGALEFTDANGKVLKTLKFEDAYCVNYTENYTAFSDQSIKDGAREHLTLVARKISVAGESHESTWLDL